MALVRVAMLLIGAASSALLAAAAKCSSDAFAVVDAQVWVNPDNMTWSDYVKPPGTDWNRSSRKGSQRNFNIALVAVDYGDKAFAVTGPPGSTVFGNPQAQAANIARDDVAAFYRRLLNEPSALNGGHTLHEYWMEDSGGRFGVDLTAFGVYRLPLLSYQYGIESDMNAGTACPRQPCDADVRNHTLHMWREAVGRDVASRFELVFVLSAGQDESSTWQEFGRMRFATREAVPASFGPPQLLLEGKEEGGGARSENGSFLRDNGSSSRDSGSSPRDNGSSSSSSSSFSSSFSSPSRGNDSSTSPNNNWATTRYYPWTSWAAASTIWPNAQDGSSVQCESSGMATYAHELSHLLRIGDNYNNPYGQPLRRSYTGPWSMLSRGSFNGPGGPHTRWHIPPLQGGSLGSLHTMRDKHQLRLIANSSMLVLTRRELAQAGPLVARLTARTMHQGLMGLRVVLDSDLSPPCDVETELLCDGGGYDNYELEVVDRMGADSFQPDAGVMISKTKNRDDVQPFQWTIDANPHDINLVDFYDANGTPVMATMGDYRQLADALFHAGTRSGSKYEHVDAANRLHLYIVDKHRDPHGVLSYTVAVRSLDSPATPKGHVVLSPGKVHPCDSSNTPTHGGVLCSFALTNSGSSRRYAQYPHLAAFQGSDVFRLQAEVKGSGWRVDVRNALVTARYGGTVEVAIAVGASADAYKVGVVTLTASSESDGQVTAQARCVVQKA